MILVTHGAVGGVVVGVLSGYPPIAFVVAFISHFVLDMIPHWDYTLNSLPKGFDYRNKKFDTNSNIKIDILKVVIDGLLGLIIPTVIVYMFNGPYFFVLIGAGLGILPDFLQAVYYKTHISILEPFMKFHNFIHNKKHIKNFYIGFAVQASIIAFVIFGFIKLL